MMAAKADLVGAIRLPDTAFKENARTEVVTDIIVMGRRDPVEQKQIQDLINAAHQSGKEDVENRRKAQEELDRDVPWIGTSEVPDPLGGEPMRVNAAFARGGLPVIGRMERSGTMHGGEQFNVKFDGNDFNARLDDATSVIINSRAGKLAQQVHPVADDVLAKTAERHDSMSDALKIALAGHEPGHIEFNEKGKLTQIAERETLTGGYELRRRLVMPNAKREDIEALVA